MSFFTRKIPIEPTQEELEQERKARADAVRKRYEEQAEEQMKQMRERIAANEEERKKEGKFRIRKVTKSYPDLNQPDEVKFCLECVKIFMVLAYGDGFKAAQARWVGLGTYPTLEEALEAKAKTNVVKTTEIIEVQ